MAQQFIQAGAAEFKRRICGKPLNPIEPPHPATRDPVRQQILFLQGGGKGAHDKWDNKLVDSLRLELGPDYEVRYPRMPNEDDPGYGSWGPAIERELATLRDGAILIGHSVGGTILLRTLAGQPPRKFGAIFLVAAPFVGDGGWPSDEIRFPRDFGALLPEGVPIHLWHGLGDETVPARHAGLYARAIPQARVHLLPGRDHQFNNDLKEVAAAILSPETPRQGEAIDARRDP